MPHFYIYLYLLCRLRFDIYFTRLHAFYAISIFIYAVYAFIAPLILQDAMPRHMPDFLRRLSRSQQEDAAYAGFFSFDFVRFTVRRQPSPPAIKRYFEPRCRRMSRDIFAAFATRYAFATMPPRHRLFSS